MNSVILLALKIAQSQYSADCCIAGSAPLEEDIPHVESMKSMSTSALAKGLPLIEHDAFLVAACLFYAACNHGANFGRRAAQVGKTKRGSA